MKLPAQHLRSRIISARIADWPRILATKHRATPAGAGFGSSRFSSPTQSFRVLYAAEDFGTAFAEAVVRDRFAERSRRYLYRPHLEGLCITAISSSRDLMLLDLRGAGAYEAGLDTDINRARRHQSGQAFSEALHATFSDVDGILFDSRLTAGKCVAIYDRALTWISGQPPIGLIQVAALPAELRRLGISLRRKPGVTAP